MKRVLRFGVLEELALQQDKEGSFIPVCTYPVHEGIVKKSIYYSCVQRECRYLRKYRCEKDFNALNNALE